MHSRRKDSWIVLATLCVLFFSTHAAAERLPIRLYTSADGLGSSFINSLRRDSRGFIWFCTRDGLSRFDGSRFVNYQIAEKDSPPGIENLYEARDGSYWITSTGGLYRFDPQKPSQPEGAIPTLNSELITSIRGEMYEDRNGTFWLAANGLFKIEMRDGHPEVVPVPLDLPVNGASVSISDMGETEDGSLWMSTSVGLVRKLSDERLVFYPDDVDANVGTRRMIVDRDDRLWITRGNLLFAMKPEPAEAFAHDERRVIVSELSPTRTVQIVPDSEVTFPSSPGELFEYTGVEVLANYRSRNPFQSSDGTLWFSAEDTLLEFSNGVARLHTIAHGLPNFMGRMTEDNVGNLWIAGRSGAVRLDRKGVVTLGRNDGAASDRFITVGQGADGTIYFGSPNFAITKLDGKKLVSVRPDIPASSIHVWTARTVFLDSHGDWWILTSEKLYRFSGVSKFEDLDRRKPTRTYGVEDGFKSDGMIEIYEDSKGAIWVSGRGAFTTGHGLARLKPGEEEFYHFSEAEGFPAQNSVSEIVEDGSGTMWMTLFDGGILRFDGEKFHSFSNDESFPGRSILTDMYLDSSGRLWVTSASEGLLRFDDPKADQPAYVQITNVNGLSSNNARTITGDRFGRIYIGTARGVDRLSPDTGRLKHYTMADGLASDFIHDSLCDRDGRLWFVTDGGISRLIPTEDERNQPPQVWLGGLRIAGVQQPTLELGNSSINTGELSDWQNNLQIDFYGIDFRAGETLRYQYKLEGGSADWSEPSESRTVNFANLRPASYQFVVRAVNSDGIASEVPAVLSFQILPPIWQRWWFVLACVAVVAITIVLFYRYRIDNLRRVNVALSDARLAEENLRRAREDRLAELESVRSRIATDLHDDIGSSLTQIAVLSEVAQAQAGTMNGQGDLLRKITDVSNELVGTMSDIVWAINPAKDHFSDLTQRMRRVAADLLSPKGIAVHFNSREEDRALTIKTNARREVFLIFKESINNIAKHSGAKNVYVDMEIERDVLTLRVRDDGRGFDCGPPSFEDTFSSESQGGNGIRNMRKRASELGGHFDIDSGPDRGTTSFLSLPLDSRQAEESATQTGGEPKA